MSDIAVTIPRRDWMDWIDEFDRDVPLGDRGKPRKFFISGNRPPVTKGDRIYFVSHNMLRGFASVLQLIDQTKRLEPWTVDYEVIFTSITVPETIPGFRGWRRRWWPRQLERKFDNWRMAGVRP